MRITKEMREDIVTRVLDFKYKDAEAQIEKDRQALAMPFYRTIVSEAEEKMIRAIPGWQDWCYSADSVTISCEGYYSLNYGHRAGQIAHLSPTLSFNANLPWRVIRNGEAFKITPNHPLYKDFIAVYKRNVKLQTEKHELRNKLRALLASCNTVKQLMAAWPEGERFFPKEIKHSTALVPVTLAHDLTTALGLKPKASPAVKAIRKVAATTK